MDPFAGLSFCVEGTVSEVAPSKPHAVSHLAMEGALGVERAFCQVVWGNSGRHASVPSLAAFGEHLAGLGLKYSDGPTYKPDGSGGFAFVDAPEGYEIELIQRSPIAKAGGAAY